MSGVMGSSLDGLVRKWRKEAERMRKMGETNQILGGWIEKCADELEAKLAEAALAQGSAGARVPRMILKCTKCGHEAGEGEWVGIVGCSRCNPGTNTLAAARGEGSEIREALEAALVRLAHPTGCGVIRPTEEWAEHGSWNFDGCNCAIKKVRDALESLAAHHGEPQARVGAAAPRPELAPAQRMHDAGCDIGLCMASCGCWCHNSQWAGTYRPKASTEREAPPDLEETPDGN